jgi:hypothetical protein
MNPFYAISKEGKEVNEFEIPYFDDVMSQNQINPTGGSIQINKVFKIATDREYDIKFRKVMYSLKPIYKVPLFSDYHLERYLGNPTEFLSQINYTILPLVDRGSRKSCAKIIQDWLNVKNPKSESKSYTISTGDINAPLQIQQDSNYSQLARA